MGAQKKTKIMFLIGSFGTGGKERQLAEIIKGLPKEKYEIALFTKNISSEYLSQQELSSIKTLNLNRKNFRISDIFRLKRFISEFKPDIVFSMASFTSHMALFISVFDRSFRLINASIQNAPLIKTTTQKINQKLLNLYPFVVANSNAGLAAYSQTDKKGRFVLRNGFNFNRIPQISKRDARTELGLNGEDRIVSMVARIDSFKDHKTYLEAAQLITEKMDVHFLVIGDGALKEETKNYAVKLGIGTNVHFLGKRDDVEKLLIASDTSVLSSTPNIGEGLSNSIIESMAAKCPVIATDNPGTRELLAGGFGIIVPPSNPKAMSEAILETLKEKGETKDMVSRAFEQAKELFDQKNMIKSFERIIDEA